MNDQAAAKREQNKFDLILSQSSAGGKYQGKYKEGQLDLQVIQGKGKIPGGNKPYYVDQKDR